MTEPMNRPADLGRIAGASALALPAVAALAAPQAPDAELLALSAEIVRRAAEADEFQKAHVAPYHDQFEMLFFDISKPRALCVEQAYAYSRESGRDAAIEQLSDFEEVTDRLFDRLRSIPATTQQGRAAKVRALLAHVMHGDWRGPGEELDWDKDMARELLAEFAGMTQEEIAAI
jgi:hypothetical protein